MTSKQKQSMTELFFLSIIYAVKGQSLELKSISKLVDKKYSDLPSIDGDALECLNKVSQRSPENFDQLVFRMGLSQQKDILGEIYSLLIQKQSKVPKICQQLVIPDNFVDQF